MKRTVTNEKSPIKKPFPVKMVFTCTCNEFFGKKERKEERKEERKKER